jgi:hypothetical protein
VPTDLLVGWGGKFVVAILLSVPFGQPRPDMRVPLVRAAVHSPGDGGREQRFSCSLCRAGVYAACRSWAAQAVFDGALSVAALKEASPATCALVTEAKSPVAVAVVASRLPAAVILAFATSPA